MKDEIDVLISKVVIRERSSLIQSVAADLKQETPPESEINEILKSNEVYDSK